MSRATFVCDRSRSWVVTPPRAFLRTSPEGHYRPAPIDSSIVLHSKTELLFSQTHQQWQVSISLPSEAFVLSTTGKYIAVIEFFSPVTVIVGHNRSGKTTVIECLKYATTGDQLPNTRGGAFIHDPKMANEKEVKAQVKLRFHATNGARMLVVRNLSVTVKKTGLTMKTLENILALADNNIDKGGNVGQRPCIGPCWNFLLLPEGSYLHEMRWDRHRNSSSSWGIKGCSGECNFLPPGRFVLASCRAIRA